MVTKKALPKKMVRPVPKKVSAPKDEPTTVDPEPTPWEAMTNDDLLIEAKAADSAAKMYADQCSEIKGVILDRLNKLEVPEGQPRKLSARKGFVSVTATRVQAKPIVTDWNKLRKLIGAAMWNRITTPQVDQGKVDALMASSDPEDADFNTYMARCSAEVPGTAYVKLTGR